MKTVLTKKMDFMNFECKLSDDRLKLFLDLTPNFTLNNLPGATNEEEIKRNICNALEDFINPELIDAEVLETALAESLKGQKVEQRRIAKGYPPGMSRDGKLVFLVKKMGGMNQITADLSGKIDFKNLHLFDNIESGQALVRVYPPVQGAPGVDALGQTIPAPPGKPAIFQIDQSIELKSSAELSYQILHAKVDGLLYQNGTQLTILEQLKIKENVDYTTGNIDFVGGVLVAGDVKPGFKIKARKNIEISGSSEAALLESTQESIHVKGQLIGSSDAQVKAAKDVVCNGARDITIFAGENIQINKECRNAYLEAGSLVNMPAATLLGGSTHVVCGLEAAEIGNDIGVKTEIYISSSLEMGPDYHNLSKSRKAHISAIQLVELHLGPLAKNPSRIQFLKPELRVKMQTLADKLAALTTSLKKLEASMAALAAAGRRSQIVRINYNKTIYAGTIVTADDQVFDIKEPLKGPNTIEYNLAEKKFNVVAKQALECILIDGAKDDKKQ